MRQGTNVGAGTAALALVAIVAILAAGVLFLAFGTNSANETRSANSSLALSSGPSSGGPGLPPGGLIGTPAPSVGEISAQNVSCSLASGVCSLTIVNNSTTPLDLQSCAVQGISDIGTTTTTVTTTIGPTTTYVAFPNGTTKTVTPNSTLTSTETSTQTATFTEWLDANGTVGGAATAAVPADSQISATCTVSSGQFLPQNVGNDVSGNFEASTVDAAGGYPAGTEVNIGFGGTWSS
jgi:hypothetical protein